ncbi:hypothetical protein IGB42_00869 [Andreprevotia sp. IGB-42]|uniref:hypothetical protein n=1 Tax=Andreprevotia sp. IGB-42 TaxID=2497473 RepID=UPI00135709D1|nr:hypothetical protein [Andreprevotia sp. IGB-42]KAF0814814.1 hypothetical protein IGB42_00869 [Andreprevotia sp. IGB-42]
MRDKTQVIQIDLMAGQTLPVYGRRGAVLHVASGEVLLAESPQWLGERMFAPHYRLRAGNVHVLDSAGWVALTALHASTLSARKLACVGAPTPLGQRVRRWLASRPGMALFARPGHG